MDYNINRKNGSSRADKKDRKKNRKINVYSTKHIRYKIKSKK